MLIETTTTSKRDLREDLEACMLANEDVTITHNGELVMEAQLRFNGSQYGFKTNGFETTSPHARSVVQSFLTRLGELVPSQDDEEPPVKRQVNLRDLVKVHKERIDAIVPEPVEEEVAQPSKGEDGRSSQLTTINWTKTSIKRLLRQAREAKQADNPTTWCTVIHEDTKLTVEYTGKLYSYTVTRSFNDGSGQPLELDYTFSDSTMSGAVEGIMAARESLKATFESDMAEKEAEKEHQLTSFDTPEAAHEAMQGDDEDDEDDNGQDEGTSSEHEPPDTKTAILAQWQKVLDAEAECIEDHTQLTMNMDYEYMIGWTEVCDGDWLNYRDNVRGDVYMVTTTNAVRVAAYEDLTNNDRAVIHAHGIITNEDKPLKLHVLTQAKVTKRLLAPARKNPSTLHLAWHQNQVIEVWFSFVTQRYNISLYHINGQHIHTSAKTQKDAWTEIDKAWTTLHRDHLLKTTTEAVSEDRKQPMAKKLVAEWSSFTGYQDGDAVTYQTTITDDALNGKLVGWCLVDGGRWTTEAGSAEVYIVTAGKTGPAVLETVTGPGDLAEDDLAWLASKSVRWVPDHVHVTWSTIGGELVPNYWALVAEDGPFWSDDDNRRVSLVSVEPPAFTVRYHTQPYSNQDVIEAQESFGLVSWLHKVTAEDLAELVCDGMTTAWYWVAGSYGVIDLYQTRQDDHGDWCDADGQLTTITAHRVTVADPDNIDGPVVVTAEAVADAFGLTRAAMPGDLAESVKPDLADQADWLDTETLPSTNGALDHSRLDDQDQDGEDDEDQDTETIPADQAPDILAKVADLEKALLVLQKACELVRKHNGRHLVIPVDEVMAALTGPVSAVTISGVAQKTSDGDMLFSFAIGKDSLPEVKQAEVTEPAKVSQAPKDTPTDQPAKRPHRPSGDSLRGWLIEQLADLGSMRVSELLDLAIDCDLFNLAHSKTRRAAYTRVLTTLQRAEKAGQVVETLVKGKKGYQVAE